MEEHSSEHTPKKKKHEVLRENPWIISTFVLGIFVLIMLIGSFGGMTGKAVSGSEAANAILDFANANGANAELVGVEKEGVFYKVTLSIQEQEIPVYVTKDGKYFTSSLISLVEEETSTETETTEIPKSDKPVVELFIWSYCPYGVQALTPFAEVASLLEDNADFKVVLYYDGHGEHETQQNKIQACIQEIDKEKYWDYAIGFVEDIYPTCSGDVECNEKESIKLMKSLGIDSDAVMSCVESQGEDLIAEDYARAKEVSVTGSPSLVINGVKASPSSRTAEAFKDSVCSAFNNAPETCSVELSSEAGTASGSC